MNWETEEGGGKERQLPRTPHPPLLFPHPYLSGRSSRDAFVPPPPDLSSKNGCKEGKGQFKDENCICPNRDTGQNNPANQIPPPG